MASVGGHWWDEADKNPVLQARVVRSHGAPSAETPATGPLVRRTVVRVLSHRGRRAGATSTRVGRSAAELRARHAAPPPDPLHPRRRPPRRARHCIRAAPAAALIAPGARLGWFSHSFPLVFFPQVQLARIQLRVPEFGWTTQKVFHLLNFTVAARAWRTTLFS